MRLLVVEDDPKIASFIVKGFKQSGFAVDHCTDGAEGLALALGEPYAAVVTDIMLPGLDGLSLVQELRKHKVMTPVLILSAKATVDDRVRGLRSGGDDYLTKPFSFVELLARVELVRRGSRTLEPSTLTIGDLSIDLLDQAALWDATRSDSGPGDKSPGYSQASQTLGRVFQNQKFHR